MPKKTKPKSGWRERPGADFRDRVRLTDEQFTAILKTVPFKWHANDLPNRHRHFRMVVESAMSSYFESKHNHNWPKPREIKAALRPVTEASRVLHKALLDLDSHSISYLERSAIAEQRIAGLVPPHPRLCDMALEINTYAKAAERRIPPARRGRKFNHALYFLVDTLSMIWEVDTGKKFTRSRKRGGSVDFVTAVVTLVDPSIGPGAIDLAMKQLIKDQRKNAASKNGEGNDP